MIFHPERIIFFHPGKVAGTAIEYAFGYTNQTHPPGQTNYEVFKGWDTAQQIYLVHATPCFMKSRVSPDIWNTYFKFTVVRNPYDRLVSVYHFQYRRHIRQFGRFEDFIEALPKVLRNKRLYNGSHYIPQYDYAYIGDARVVDSVLKFESLDADFQQLCTRLGKTLTLPRVNTATSRHRPTCPTAALYSPASVRVVQELYRKDFECFGYPLEPPGADAKPTAPDVHVLRWTPPVIQVVGGTGGCTAAGAPLKCS